MGFFLVWSGRSSYWTTVNHYFGWAPDNAADHSWCRLPLNTQLSIFFILNIKINLIALCVCMCVSVIRSLYNLFATIPMVTTVFRVMILSPVACRHHLVTDTSRQKNLLLNYVGTPHKEWVCWNTLKPRIWMIYLSINWCVICCKLKFRLSVNECYKRKIRNIEHQKQWNIQNYFWATYLQNCRKTPTVKK